MKAVNMAKTEYREITPLNPAIEQIYAVFRSYKAPKELLDVCIGCCMDIELEKEMRRIPLRQISANHFYEYNGSAKSTEQPPDEIKYLLPRLLELLASDADLHHSTELNLQRLGNCQEASFTKQELEAIDTFALAYFAQYLSQHPWQVGKIDLNNEIFDILLMFDIGGVDLPPLLDYWLNNEDTSATLHYVSAGFGDFWQCQSIQNAFGIDRPLFQETMKNWLTNESNRYAFAGRILALDMSIIDQKPVYYYTSEVTAKQMTETVFDLISY
jgi:hypothetical protein